MARGSEIGIVAAGEVLPGFCEMYSGIAAAALFASAALACGAPRPQAEDSCPSMPPPASSTCEAFPASEGEPPVVSGCDWVPARKEPRVVHVEPRDLNYQACPYITTLGSGEIAMPLGREEFHERRIDDRTIWGLHARDGRLLQTFVANDLLLGRNDPLDHTVMGVWLSYRPYCSREWESLSVGAWGPGDFSADSYLAWALPQWSVGGVTTGLLMPPANGLILALSEHQSNNAEMTWRTVVRIFDDRGRECGAPWVAYPGPEFSSRYIALDDQRRVFILFESWFPPRKWARWFTVEGTPLTEEFPVDTPAADCGHWCSSEDRSLIPLIGGGVVYQEGLQYLTFFPSGEARFEPAPAWLAAMPGHRLHRVGRRGYALIPNDSALRYGSDCEDRIEFVSTNGDHCGTLPVDEIFSCPGVSQVGRDGTVLQLAKEWYRDSEQCQVAVWDALLQ